MGYATAIPGVPKDLIFTSAVFEGFRRTRRRSARKWRPCAHREKAAADPGKDRRLDLQEPGRQFGLEGSRCCGLPRIDDRRGADVPMHCNFMINTGNATGHDLETARRNRARARAETPASGWSGKSSVLENSGRKARLSRSWGRREGAGLCPQFPLAAFYLCRFPGFKSGKRSYQGRTHP
jgi:hypothetical protein